MDVSEKHSNERRQHTHTKKNTYYAIPMTKKSKSKQNKVMILEVRIVISLGNAKIETGKGTRRLLRGFLDLDANYTTHLLCENSSSYVF